MKKLMLAAVAALMLTGCATTSSTRVVGGPSGAPSNNPNIQPHNGQGINLGWFGKTVLLGGVIVGGIVLWKWDD